LAGGCGPPFPCQQSYLSDWSHNASSSKSLCTRCLGIGFATQTCKSGPPCGEARTPPHRRGLILRSGLTIEMQRLWLIGLASPRMHVFCRQLLLCAIVSGLSMVFVVSQFAWSGILHAIKCLPRGNRVTFRKGGGASHPHCSFWRISRAPGAARQNTRFPLGRVL
jgi:hypothetical protein